MWFWFAFPWWLAMLSIFSCACWPFIYPLWWSVCSNLLPNFLLSCLSFIIELLELLIYSGYRYFVYLIYALQIFSPDLCLAFLFSQWCLLKRFFFLFKIFFFLMWTIFKVFIEFVTVLLLFYVLLFWPWGMWDLSSPARDWTHTPCIGRWGLNHWTTREVPLCVFWRAKWWSLTYQCLLAETTLPTTVGKNFSSMFFSRCLIPLGYTFRSVIHFELILCMMWGKGWC